MQLMRLAEAVARSAAADREARELYERAVVPLNIQAGLIRYQRDEQHLATVDPELAEVMRVNGAVRPGPAREQIDYTILSPETVKVLRGETPKQSAPQNATASRPHRARQTPAHRDEGYER